MGDGKALEFRASGPSSSAWWAIVVLILGWRLVNIVRDDFVTTGRTPWQTCIEVHKWN